MINENKDATVVVDEDIPSVSDDADGEGVVVAPDEDFKDEDKTPAAEDEEQEPSLKSDLLRLLLIFIIVFAVAFCYFAWKDAKKNKVPHPYRIENSVDETGGNE
jgi:hypothetical protein